MATTRPTQIGQTKQDADERLIDDMRANPALTLRSPRTLARIEELWTSDTPSSRALLRRILTAPLKTGRRAAFERPSPLKVDRLYAACLSYLRDEAGPEAVAALGYPRARVESSAASAKLLHDMPAARAKHLIGALCGGATIKAVELWLASAETPPEYVVGVGVLKTTVDREPDRGADIGSTLRDFFSALS